MSARDLSPEDLEGLLHTSEQRFAQRQFADLDEHPCSAVESTAMTVGAFLLFVAAPAIVFFAWMLL